MWTQILPDPAHTQALGEALGRSASGRVVVALVGDLGAGKTCFAQGVGTGLSVAHAIVSPTFVLMAQYEGRLSLLHADVYRLEAADLPGIGLEEAIEDCEGVALVEWADRFPGLLPDDHLQVVITHLDEGRSLSAVATGPHHAAVLRQWQFEAGDG